MTEFPKTVPEMRGISMNADARERERTRQRPYSAASYAAQYGITVEDAEAFTTSHTSHKEIVRRIMTLFAKDPDLKSRALMLENDFQLSAEEQERYRRILGSGEIVSSMESSGGAR